MKKKPTIEIKINNWTKRTRSEQNDALEWLYKMIYDLYEYRKNGISDEFWGESK